MLGRREGGCVGWALRADGGLAAPRSNAFDGRLEAGPTKTPRSRVLAVTTGAFEGRIGLPGQVPRGEGGFGYDPLFLVAPDFARTSAELDKTEKNRLSHRGAAVRAMIDRLRALADA
ncbi:MAG: non-canonical purine NTP pyrophosphatase [Planctomycetes bacterium]|nr:non-canonical purine NTP pyrophosphatase [Planctomycetota bacterium]